MFYFFFDQDGIVWHYDSERDTSTCQLGKSFIVEEGCIIFLDEDGEEIDTFELFNYELFDKIIM